MLQYTWTMEKSAKQTTELVFLSYEFDTCIERVEEGKAMLSFVLYVYL